MRRPLMLLIVFVLVAVSSACGYFADGEKPRIVMQLDKGFASSAAKFGFGLFHELYAEEGEGNRFISPLSVFLALSMTYNGAAGETQKAMADALQLQGIGLDELNRVSKQLTAFLEENGAGAKLSIANSLWGREGLEFNKQFLENNRKYYDAKLTSLDFGDASAAKTINRWVEEQTEGKIDKIVADPIPPNILLFLINAIYFKGEWTDAFNENLTKETDFHLADGTVKKHPMMERRGRYAYFRGDLFQAIRVPYGNGQYGMTVFLPDESSDLGSFYSILNEENWAAWTTRMNTSDKTEGTIVLPKFKLEYDVRLNDVLKALGMGIAFEGGRADFSNMLAHGNAYISEVKHKTFVEVNEKGTEAAAVTKVAMQESAAVNAFHMKADRPFFFTIQENTSGLILFMGSVVDPEAS